MESLSPAELAGLPVRLKDVTLGRVVDILFDAQRRRILGFVVDCGDEATRFLPYVASDPSTTEISVPSALMLLDDVGFYLERGVSFRSLAGVDIPTAA